MDLLLGEHGEALLYGIIGTMMVLLVCSIYTSKWKNLTPEYKVSTSKTNREFIEKNKGKFPVIDADEIIFVEHKDEKFNYRDFISAKDYNGKDITESMNIYGDVDVFRKGTYKLRCVVVSDNSLACTKYVNVVVE